MSLDPIQVDTLLAPIKPHRVLTANGQSHLPAYDVIAHLNRLFGFAGWDKEILDLSLIHERSVGVTDTAQGRWWVTYGCRMRLSVKDPEGHLVKVIEDAATGTSQNQQSPGDAHDMAMKAAVSYALKRCAKDLGDQFGLSLYNKGQKTALVVKTIVGAGGRIDTAAAADIQDNAPVPQSMGNDELDPDVCDCGCNGNWERHNEIQGTLV